MDGNEISNRPVMDDEQRAGWVKLANRARPSIYLHVTLLAPGRSTEFVLFEVGRLPPKNFSG